MYSCILHTGYIHTICGVKSPCSLGHFRATVGYAFSMITIHSWLNSYLSNVINKNSILVSDDVVIKHYVSVPSGCSPYVRTYVRGTTLPTGDCEGAEGLPSATEEQRGSPHLDECSECWHRELRETAKAPKVTLSISSFCNHAVVEDNLGVNLLTKSFLLQVFKFSCIFFETIVFALTAFRSG